MVCEPVGAVAAGVQGDSGVAAHGQDVADAAVAEKRAEGCVVPVHLVAGHPTDGHPGVERRGDHLLGQFGLGGEGDVVRDTGGGPPFGVLAPGRAGQVEPPVYQRPTARRRVGQKHRDLAVFDPAGGAGVLALHAHRAAALLQEAGLVDDEDAVRMAEPVRDQAPHAVSGPVVIPDHRRQQSLHCVGSAVPGALGEPPPVLAFHRRQQPADERTHRLTRLGPHEQTLYRPHDLVEQRRTGGQV